MLAGAVCTGLAAANLARVGFGPAILAAAVCTAAAASGGVRRPLAALALALALVGWWWGSARLDRLDRSPLSSHVGQAGRAVLVVTGPARSGRFQVRAPASVRTFDGSPVGEPVLLELPRGRAPPQGAVLEAVGQLSAPHGPRHGFDERTWLRRHGVHVLVRVSAWRITGRRGGLGRVADDVRRRLRESVAHGLHGERAGVIEGVVLGEDAGLSDGLRRRFRASGLYHLLAVSGQNVALVGGSVLALAWLLGVSRMIGQLGALAAIAAYVLAVGAQPSVVRAGVAGALGSIAWLSSRTADRWHVLAMGAIALLAWNPYTLLDAGFQLSFAAVTAIFVLVPPFQRLLEGYPLGKPLRLVVAVSAACGVATAPISWLQFHSIQLLTIPANALAAPVVAPLLGLALAAAVLAPLSPGAAAMLVWLNGWCAAYLVAVARFVGGLPLAQIRSTRALLVLLAGAFLAAAYASSRWQSSSLST